MRHLPLIAPRPPRLSAMADRLRAIEESGVFSNGGPVVRGFEAAATAKLFSGAGDCLAVANATLGLMLAIRHAAGEPRRAGRFALMPAFTFAAAAHAADWAGLTPLLCDIDPDLWAACPKAEEEMLRLHGERIAVIVPYATFGAAIDLDRYRWLARRHGVGVVIDAAASLGTIGADGNNFGAGAPFAIVYSMHATKTFATAEGGLIHSGDRDLIAALRSMTNFGFGAHRSAERPGLNAKLPEVLGLLASERLEDIDAVCDHRAALDAAYRARLGDRFSFQARTAARQAMQFQPVLLPASLADRRPALIAKLAKQGVGAACYFSPHLGQQPWVRRAAQAGATPVADAVAARMLSLPITDAMTPDDAAYAADALVDACASVRPAARRVAPLSVRTLVVGGGPAGTAFLTAAAKRDRLTVLARAGLAIVEAGDGFGGGLLGGYAIGSDSTAETFLSAVKDNVHADIAALVDHPSGAEIARHIGALGVPLTRAAPFLEATGARLRAIVEREGGHVLLRSRVRYARRTRAGKWRAAIRDADGRARDILADNLVLATGGYQSHAHAEAEPVGGVPLGARVGARLMLADELLRVGGVERLRERIADRAAPRIAILGGSTSALAACALLLKSGLPLGRDALALLHRRPLRPFYPSAQAARADGFTDFTREDICPVSGFVYRLAGFRLEARELVLRILGVGGRAPDPRLAATLIAGDADLAPLDEADVVVAALGYRPHALPLFGVSGDPIALNAHAPGRPDMVDRQCRVIEGGGSPIPGVYGIGLAAGFVPHGALGGEPSFRGKANGLWLWQNDVGAMIVDQLLDHAARRVA